MDCYDCATCTGDDDLASFIAGPDEWRPRLVRTCPDCSHLLLRHQLGLLRATGVAVNALPFRIGVRYEDWGVKPPRSRSHLRAVSDD
ncbi:hypothetical protein BCF74_11337 [Knoellia remsis]|uniref:Uncharacterized protein n=1 Tax=Knoellia remsis TaxID=407159 RepID=A0A2T0UJQ0_9MICO|nr:hypothetical protein [Knoellia remsis]PRY58114.1 hypothetical protein BCF74_11337 [Knoellia remsis]